MIIYKQCDCLKSTINSLSMLHYVERISPVRRHRHHLSTVQLICQLYFIKRQISFNHHHYRCAVGEQHFFYISIPVLQALVLQTLTSLAKLDLPMTRWHCIAFESDTSKQITAFQCMSKHGQTIIVSLLK